MKYIIITALIIITGYVSGYILKTTEAQIDVETGITSTSTMDGRCPMERCPMDDNIGTSTCPYMMDVNKSPEQAKLKEDMRKLWTDHIIWTANAANAILGDMPGKDEITARLLKNPTDMANAIRPYYGDDVAVKFEELMKGHLTIAADFITAVKTSDEAKVSDLDAKWHQNADQIADLLSQANPDWPREEVKNMMYEHLDLLKKEIGYHINRNIPEAISNFDRIEDQALKMADAMSSGIIKQFPDKF